MIDERFELLCGLHLDGEASEEERAELFARIESDRAARRRYDEYVALEGVLLAVSTSDRVDLSTPDAIAASLAADPALADASRAVPEEDSAFGAEAWLSTAAGALLLLAIVILGGGGHTESPEAPIAEDSDPPAPNVLPVEFASVPPGIDAIPVPTEDPTIQFCWIGLTEPAKGTNE